MAHGHEHSSSNQSHGCKIHISKTRRLLMALSLTILFFVIETAAGYYIGSVAIAADAIHMLGDSLGLVIAMTAVRMSKRKSKKNTFGWARAQELGALTNSILLLSLCFTIIVQAVKRLIRKEIIEEKLILKYIIVGVIGLLINILALFILGGEHGHSHGGSDHGHSHGHGHSHNHSTEDKDQNELSDDPDSTTREGDRLNATDTEHLCTSHHDHDEDETDHDHHDHHGHSHGPNQTEAQNNHDHHENSNKSVKTKSKKQKKPMDGGQMNMRGAYLHVLTDALGSVIVIISGLCIRQWYDQNWVALIDPIASLLMISLIIIFTLPLLRDSALVLLQTAPIDTKVDEVQKRLVKEIPGILSVHEFHVWQLSGMKIVASAHIRCQNLEFYISVAEKIKDFFHKEGIHSTTIQPEFVDDEVANDLSSDETCILQNLRDHGDNGCCIQQTTALKQRGNKINKSQSTSIMRDPTQREVVLPMIEITPPSRSNSSKE